jgi:hypothetical protein
MQRQNVSTLSGAAQYNELLETHQHMELRLCLRDS